MQVKEQTIAKVSIYQPGKMTAVGRKRIAKWLHSRAKWLEKHGDLATNKGYFTQRWIVS